MIDLTPLEVRKKKGDFRRAMRGYDPALVDDFLDLVADRLEELVRENMSLLERVGRQEEQVRDYRDRERALTEALVSAQEMREEVRRQAVREAELATRAAQQEAEQMRSSAEQEVRHLRSTAQQAASEALASLKQERQREEQVVRELRARREEFMENYRALLEQELEELNVVARAAGVPHVRTGARNAQQETAPARRAFTGGQLRPDVQEPVSQPDIAGRSSAAQPAAPEPVPSDAVARQAAPDDALIDDDEDLPAVGETDMRLEDLTEDDVSDESAFALGASVDEVAALDEEPFAPEPFMDDDESDAVLAAWDEEVTTLDTGAVTEADDGANLYDGIAGDEDGDGVPGPIGLGDAEPWEETPPWSIADLKLTGGNDEGDALDLGDEDIEDENDEEMQRLLKNAAAAGYRLEDDPLADELLLDEAVPEDTDGEPEPTVDDGWLPTLLEDDK